MCAKGRWEDQEEREVTDNGSLGKGTVKGSVFPGEGMRYLKYGGRALLYSSTRYFQGRPFTGCFIVVCSLYGTSIRYTNKQLSNDTPNCNYIIRYPPV
jgi:hypothetical protein